MNVSIKLEKDDWLRFQKYLEKDIQKKNKSWVNGILFSVILWFILAFIFMNVFNAHVTFHWPTAGMATLFYGVFMITNIFNLHKFKKACIPADSGVFLGEHRFILNNEGINSIGKGYEGKQSWSLVQRVERSDGMILIFMDTVYAYIFPETKLENPEEFYSYVASHAK